MGAITRTIANNLTTQQGSFDDNKLVNDLSTLGLRVHTQENLNASNTNSQYVDVFQDTSGYTNGANTTRDSSEFVSTGSTSSSGLTLTKTGGTNSSVTVSSTKIEGGGSGSGVYWYMSIASPATYYDFQYTLNQKGGGGGPTFASGVWLGSDNPDGYYFDQGSTRGKGYNIFGSSSSVSDVASYRYTVATKTFSNLSNLGSLSTGGNFNSQSATPLRFFFPQWIDASPDWDISYVVTAYTDTVNATGNFTCPTITAPVSTSSMGAVITYQDQAGTNALNTDIVLQLSADNGSNYTTATLTALPDFASGIKMAKVNDLSVTAGTQLKYKISFANQASGSKEARIRGVSLNY